MTVLNYSLLINYYEKGVAELGLLSQLNISHQALPGVQMMLSAQGTNAVCAFRSINLFK